MRQHAYCWIAIALPILPLLNGLLVEPYGNPKVELGIDAFPVFEVVSLVFLLVVGRAARVRVEFFCAVLSFVTVVYALLGVIHGVPYIGFVLLILHSFMLASVDWSSECAFKRVSCFIVSLMLLSIVIMILRLKMYDFDFIRARSGANIYGANAVVNLSLLYLSYRFLVVEPSRRDFVYLGLAIFLSFLFISKTGILISLMLLFAYFFCFIVRDFKGFFKGMAIMALLCAGFLAVMNSTSLGEAVLFRFGFENIAEHGLFFAVEAMLKVQQEQQRGVLWQQAISLIVDYPATGVGLGRYSEFGHHTSAHNLFLNNWAEYGLIFGFVLNLIFIVPFALIAIYSIPVRKKLFVLFAYGMFLLQALTAGQKILQTSGYLSAFLLFTFFSMLLQLRQPLLRKENSE